MDSDLAALEREHERLSRLADLVHDDPLSMALIHLAYAEALDRAGWHDSAKDRREQARRLDPRACGPRRVPRA